MDYLPFKATVTSDPVLLRSFDDSVYTKLNVIFNINSTDKRESITLTITQSDTALRVIEEIKTGDKIVFRARMDVKEVGVKGIDIVVSKSFFMVDKDSNTFIIRESAPYVLHKLSITNLNKLKSTTEYITTYVGLLELIVKRLIDGDKIHHIDFIIKIPEFNPESYRPDIDIKVYRSPKKIAYECSMYTTIDNARAIVRNNVSI